MYKNCYVWIMEESKLKNDNDNDVEKMDVQLELEKEITKQLQLKAKIAKYNVESRKLAIHRHEIFLNMFQLKMKKNSSKIGIDIDQLLKMYFIGYPSHHPYVYWQTICHFRAPSDLRMLENALKNHKINKYVNWLSCAQKN